MVDALPSVVNIRGLFCIARATTNDAPFERDRIVTPQFYGVGA